MFLNKDDDDLQVEGPIVGALGGGGVGPVADPALQTRGGRSSSP